MGLDGTQCAWANQPHLAVCPFVPNPQSTRCTAWHLSWKGFSLFGPCASHSSVGPERACQSPPAPPDPPRVTQVLEEQLRVHGHPDLLSSGHCPCPKSLPHALAWAQRYRRAVSQTLSALSWHQGGRGG